MGSILTGTWEEGISIPILCMRKPRLRRVKQPAQGHKESGKELEMNPGLPDLQARRCFLRVSTSVCQGLPYQ